MHYKKHTLLSFKTEIQEILSLLHALTSQVMN